jgi:hypothetical protein
MCVLRAGGPEFDVDAFLSTSSFKVTRVHRKGEPRFVTKPDGPRRERSGFNVDVSAKEWSDLPGQIDDAKAFLSENEAELLRLRSSPGVEGVQLDFPMDLRIGTKNIAVQSDRLPADILLAAGRLGVDIVMTIYPRPGESESSQEPTPADGAVQQPRERGDA